MTKTVTSLRERKRDKVEVELDGEPWRVLPATAVVRAQLRVGRPLDRESARLLARELRRAQALARATRALSTRDRSRGELEARLDEAGVSGTAREDALSSLEALGLVDDVRVAESRARDMARRGYGDAAIRSDLRLRRIDAETISAAIEALEPESDRAVRIVEGKERTPALLRRLASRGFSRDSLEVLESHLA
ncbi:MAG: regulatory protein [Gaiellaceae bacterium]|nr:regulatory protein [Gaiellaceae bacterium]